MARQDAKTAKKPFACLASLREIMGASRSVVPAASLNWLRAGESNATRMAYEASMTPVHLPASKLELFPGGALCQIRTDLSGLQVRRIAFYAYRARYSGARGGIRNPNLRVTGAALFHLSYSGLERVRRIELR